MNTTISEEAATFYITLNKDTSCSLQLKVFYKALAGGSGVLCVDMSGVATLGKEALAIITDFKKVSAQKGIELVLVHVRDSLIQMTKAAGFKHMVL